MAFVLVFEKRESVFSCSRTMFLSLDTFLEPGVRRDHKKWMSWKQKMVT